jgi:zinc/manganese transport system ATP-binding protein
LSAVSLDDLTLSVGGATILAGINLEIAEGEIIGLLGPNGSGKTTLIRAILGLRRPASGSIRVFGKPVRRGDSTIGYLPQTHAAPAEVGLSGREILASSVNGHRFGLPIHSRRDNREIDAALEAVGGETLATRPFSAMSGGQRQRLLIAEALIGKPRLLLLDEPLISLDQHQQHLIVELVRRLSKEFGLTVIFSAHELNQVLGAIDRVLYLGGGHAALGTVDEVVTPAILSRLYGARIEVIRAGGRIFVMSDGEHIEREHHHDHAHL